jgi:hypothetical protein
VRSTQKLLRLARKAFGNHGYPTDNATVIHPSVLTSFRRVPASLSSIRATARPETISPMAHLHQRCFSFHFRRI